jgi:transcriptional regulator with XRE-family HTH domain
MNNYEEQIGGNIREVRLELGYSQDKLAKMCEISSSTLSAYENSKKIPNLITIAKIAKALEVSIERLYNGDENISFVKAVPDEGRKIVNCIYVLWKLGVISYYENFMSIGRYIEHPGRPSENGFFLAINKYSWSIKRLITSLNEYRKMEETYDEPDKYLEMVLSSVAKEINNEIEKKDSTRV